MAQEMYWNNMYESFKKRYAPINEEVVSWYPSDKFEIMVELKNGARLVYDDLDKSVRTIARPRNSQHLENEDEWRKEFSASLRKRLKMKGITQAELADRIGISSVSMSKYMNMKATPSGYMIHRMAEALGCTDYDLVRIK